MRSILVTGLCTLHWGRLQYGNVGNYYIVEPLFRQLSKHFKNYKIITTFQMDDSFIEKEHIEVLPMEFYYSWNNDLDLQNAYHDVENAEKFVHHQSSCALTPYLNVLLECDYVIDVSGDMWGDNAEHVGHNRFIVDCLKMKAAQILGKKTILYAVTPGPFSKREEELLAREVFPKFSLVLIREKVSEKNLQQWGFPVDNVQWAPCPSYLFEPNASYKSQWTQWIEKSQLQGSKVVGLTFGGFNMPQGPYDMWPRENSQYDNFVTLAEYIVNELSANIIIFSHTNGFELPPEFKLKNGRDFLILNQFYNILLNKQATYKEKVALIDEPLLPCNLKEVIGELDMLVTGRVHASVAATSQYVPTVYIEYDRNVIYSDKMTGFSEQLGMAEFVCNPKNIDELKKKTAKCYYNLSSVRKRLQHEIPIIQKKAEEVFEEIKKV
ncbi:MAG: polysaccharide pyruvyl transferase family protein [Lachnospiraceae bacterium]|nr:polysaccharide pyruvyl transferase family protein [Lachnospiraceae bacterium]